MPQFTKQKQQASVQSQLGAKNFAEFLAQRGQTRAGLATQGELSRQNVLGRQIGEIGTAENQAVQQFGQQRADIETQYQQNLTSAYGDIESQLRQNLYNEKLRKEQQAREDAQRKQSFQQEVYLRNLSTVKPTNKTLEGILLDWGMAVANQLKGVKGKDGNTMIWSVPNETGGITQFKYAIGVNPFTGSTNKALLTNGKYDPAKAFSNGYQPNTYQGIKLKSTGKKDNRFGQEQNIYKVKNNYYVIWDGQNNKYIRV